eukprot:3170874-Rhodomonas_salina.3
MTVPLFPASSQAQKSQPQTSENEKRGCCASAETAPLPWLWICLAISLSLLLPSLTTLLTNTKNSLSQKVSAPPRGGGFSGGFSGVQRFCLCNKYQRFCNGKRCLTNFFSANL